MGRSNSLCSSIRAASLNRRLFHFLPCDGCRRSVCTESVSTSPKTLINSWLDADRMLFGDFRSGRLVRYLDQESQESSTKISAGACGLFQLGAYGNFAHTSL